MLQSGESDSCDLRGENKKLPLSLTSLLFLQHVSSVAPAFSTFVLHPDAAVSAIVVGFSLVLVLVRGSAEGPEAAVLPVPPAQVHSGARHVGRLLLLGDGRRSLHLPLVPRGALDDLRGEHIHRRLG